MGTPRELADPATPEEQAGRLRRHYGVENPGAVDLRHFDQGLVETLGAFVENQRYWLMVDGVDPPPDRPGILVTFSYPESEFKAYVVPLVLIRRDDLAPALERWHPHSQVWRAPSPGASPVTVGGVQGYDQVQTGYQAVPYDITYTIQIVAHYRGAPGQRGAAQLILKHVLDTYPPFGEMMLVDSLGDPRTYNTFMEGTSVLDEVPEIAERVLGFGVTVRVEGELDYRAPAKSRTVTQPAVLTVQLKEL